ncbi:hypothetical protein V6N13_015884 [Hibiscus sabdariffa]
MIEGMNRSQDAVILGFQLACMPFSVFDVGFNALCEVTINFDVRNPFGSSWKSIVAKYRDIMTNTCSELRMLTSPSDKNDREDASGDDNESGNSGEDL